MLALVYETPTGAIDGVNRVFRLSHQPVGAVVVFVSGLASSPCTAPASRNIVFTTPPDIGSTVYAAYTPESA